MHIGYKLYGVLKMNEVGIKSVTKTICGFWRKKLKEKLAIYGYSDTDRC
jgi:hypothetical protein